MDAGARAGRVGFDHDQAPVDLRAPVHPRGIFLADEAAFGEAHSVEFSGVTLKPQNVAELGAVLTDAKAEAVLEPAGDRFVLRSEPPAAEFRQARIGNAFAAVPCPMHCERGIALDADR